MVELVDAKFLATKKMLQVGVLTKITKSPHNRIEVVETFL